MPRTLKRPAARSARRSRAQIKSILDERFRREFPTDTVDVSNGYQGNIHILVVSRRFDQMSEREKPGYMWKIIDETELSDDEKGLVSMVLPLSPAELK